MRHTTTLLAATLLLAGAAVGCTQGGSTTAKASPSPSVDPGDKFIGSVVDAHLSSYSDGIPAAAQLKQFPPKWCDALDAGHSVKWMLDGTELYPVGETWGTEKTDAYRLVLLGVEAYCPKYRAQVRQELRESGEY